MKAISRPATVALPVLLITVCLPHPAAAEDCCTYPPDHLTSPSTCQFKRQHPGYEPPMNHCGPQDDKDASKAVDFVANLGPIDFNVPCDAHDKCYGTCDVPKVECDTAFQNALLDNCVAGGSIVYPPYPCFLLAYVFYQGVANKGDDSYRDGQNAACDCCNTVDMSSDPLNCGACEHTCQLGQICNQTSCEDIGACESLGNNPPVVGFACTCDDNPQCSLIGSTCCFPRQTCTHRFADFFSSPGPCR